MRRGAAPDRDEREKIGRLRHRARRTRKLPLRVCALSATWRENGRARLLVVREQRDGRMIVGRFDVDKWCMGLVSAEVACDVGVTALHQLREETFADTESRVGRLNGPAPRLMDNKLVRPSGE